MGGSTAGTGGVAGRGGAGGSGGGSAGTGGSAVPTVPAAPTGLTLTARSSARIDVAYTDNANNETGFVIERSSQSASAGFAQVTVTGANVATFMDTTVKPAMTYWYRVRARNTAGESTNSATLSVNSGGVAYVAQSGDGQLALIDLMTEQLLTTVPVGGGAFAVAVDRTQRKVFVANQADDSVSVLGIDDNVVQRTFGVGDNPQSIAVNEARSRAYVGNLGVIGSGSDTVSIIDTAANSVLKAVTVGTDPTGIAVADQGNASGVFVPLGASNTVAVIDVASDAVTTLTLPTAGVCCRDVTYQNATYQMWVMHVPCNAPTTARATVTQIVSTTKAFGTPFQIQGNGQPTSISADTGVNGYVYTAHPSQDLITVTEYVNKSLVANVTVGDFPTKLGFVGASYRRVYVSNCTGNSVSIVDAATNAVVKTVTVGSCPRGVGFVYK
jgi:YVTN family beta-propeller protein